MEEFGTNVAEVGHDEDEKGLYDTDVVRESGHEGSQEAPQDTDQGPAHGHHEEGGHARQVIHGNYVGGAHLSVTLKHMVQHLWTERETHF